MVRVMADAKVIPLTHGKAIADLRERLTASLTVNGCIERAHRYRKQAGDLARAGRCREASESLEEAERAERHAQKLATMAKDRSGQ